MESTSDQRPTPEVHAPKPDAKAERPILPNNGRKSLGSPRGLPRKDKVLYNSKRRVTDERRVVN